MQTHIFELNSSTTENFYRVTVSCGDDGKWRAGNITVQAGGVIKLFVESLGGIFKSAEAAIGHAINWAILQIWKLENPGDTSSLEKK